MKGLIFKIIRLSWIAKLSRFIYQRQNVTILVFHNPTPASFGKAVQYLQKKYNVISLLDYLTAFNNRKLDTLPPCSVCITFDDGHQGNYSLLPIIKQHNIPVTVFLTAGVTGTNRHFWFTKKGEIDQSVNLKKLPNKKRKTVLESLGFDEIKEYESPQALSEQQIKEMAPYVDFQSHTMFHPILPMCTDEEAGYEIFESKKQLESKYGFKINSIAYPNGDYSEREINFCKKAGYLAAFTTESGFNNKLSDPFRLKRIGTNDTENMDEFVLRVSGVWFMFKKFTSLFRKKTRT